MQDEPTQSPDAAAAATEAPAPPPPKPLTRAELVTELSLLQKELEPATATYVQTLGELAVLQEKIDASTEPFRADYMAVRERHRAAAVYAAELQARFRDVSAQLARSLG